jgi:hypothetical protein
MPVKLPLQSVFFSIQVKLTKLEKYTKVLLQWTGWNKKQKEVLPLLLLLLHVAGISQQIKGKHFLKLNLTTSISLIPQDT